MDKTTEMVGLKYVAPHPARVKPEDTVPEARWDVNTMTEEGYQMLIEDYTIEVTDRKRSCVSQAQASVAAVSACTARQPTTRATKQGWQTSWCCTYVIGNVYTCRMVWDEEPIDHRITIIAGCKLGDCVAVRSS
jgi:hypothetical protein